jgi:hypothetical protein
MTSGFMLIPEGKDIFRIYDATYDEEFGRIEVKLVNAKGMTHTERFSILNKDGEYNDGAMGAFSYFAKCAMNDFEMEDIDPEELIDHYIEAVVEHNQVPSKKDETKMSTFANFGDKFPADGFTEEPCERALTLGPKSESKTTHAKKSAQKATQKPTKTKSGGLDLDALLGG